MFTEKVFFFDSKIISSNIVIQNYEKPLLPRSLPYTINYKNIYLLRRHISLTGKIIPRHITKLTAKEHRSMAKAIRQARRVGLLPFVWLTHLLS